METKSPATVHKGDVAAAILLYIAHPYTVIASHLPTVCDNITLPFHFYETKRKRNDLLYKSLTVVDYCSKLMHALVGALTESLQMSVVSFYEFDCLSQLARNTYIKNEIKKIK